MTAVHYQSSRTSEKRISRQVAGEARPRWETHNALVSLYMFSLVLLVKVAIGGCFNAKNTQYFISRVCMRVCRRKGTKNERKKVSRVVVAVKREIPKKMK